MTLENVRMLTSSRGGGRLALPPKSAEGSADGKSPFETAQWIRSYGTAATC